MHTGHSAQKLVRIHFPIKNCVTIHSRRHFHAVDQRKGMRVGEGRMC